LIAGVTTTFTTGLCPSIGLKLAHLANSKTADRSGNSVTLTETGTITEAPVETSAELNGYAAFASGVTLISTATAAMGTVYGGTHTTTVWFKRASAPGAREYIASFFDDTGTQPIYLTCETSGAVRSSIGGGASADCTTPGSFCDDEWHRMDVVFRGNGGASDHQLYVDGVLEDTSTASWTGSTGTNYWIAWGCQVDNAGARVGSDFGGELALGRFANDGGMSAANIRRAYEAEKGMFVANAKCLLQGADDVVLDARIDKATGKVAVTQSTGIAIFDGLVIDSEPTGSGTSPDDVFEHALLNGGDLSFVTSELLYTEVLAVENVRGSLEMLRGLANKAPGGVDLSKAKAWVFVDSNAIQASMNIESLSAAGGGSYTVTLSTPFKSSNYVVVGTLGGPPDVGSGGEIKIDQAASLNDTKEVEVQTANSSGTGTDRAFCLVFFGELENDA